VFDPNLFEAALAQKASTEVALGLRNDVEAYHELQVAEIAEDFAEELRDLGVTALEGDSRDEFDS
jgi:hypothetical protein